METKNGRFGSMIVYSVIVAIFLLIVLCLIFFNSSDARAGSDEPAAGENKAQSEATQPAIPDPNRQSAFLFPSAYTLPKDEISMDILGFQALGVRWGVADRVQLNLGFRLIGFSVGATTKIVETQNSALALDAAVSLPVTSFDNGYPVLFSVNPVYSVGGDDLTFTMGTTVLGITTEKGALAIPYMSIMKRVGRKSKLFLELADGVAMGDIFGEHHQGANYVFAAPGIRLHGEKFSCDLALIVPLYYENLYDHYWIAPFPSFSIHF